MKKYLCREPSCRTLLDKPGYCDLHTKTKTTARPFEHAERSNNYNTSRWRALVRQCIRETPYCEICGASKKDGAILEAHHRTPARGDDAIFYDAGNLQTLCRSCHRLVTAREIGKRNCNRSRITGRGGQ